VASLDHPALLYSNPEEFLGFMAPYVRRGLDADETVFVAARSDNLAALRAELGSDGATVRWADTDSWHPHTGTRLRAFHDLVTEEVAGGRSHIRLAGEPVWPNREPGLTGEWQRYESVLNHVLEPYPVSLVCLYDAAILPAPILDVARQTHPAISRGNGVEPSAAFVDPTEFLRLSAPKLTRPPIEASRLTDLDDLSAARHFLEDRAVQAGVDRDRASDLCLAANEVLTNAIVHADGIADLSTWIEDDRFVCNIRDRGPGLGDPLAGYRPPTGQAVNGYGLWMARQLVDLVQVSASDDGTDVRLHARRAA
jgi:anti-sigma regulatory factor (Ser/Thr protein kinase)